MKKIILVILCFISFVGCGSSQKKAIGIINYKQTDYKLEIEDGIEVIQNGETSLVGVYKLDHEGLKVVALSDYQKTLIDTQSLLGHIESETGDVSPGLKRHLGHAYKFAANYKTTTSELTLEYLGDSFDLEEYVVKVFLKDKELDGLELRNENIDIEAFTFTTSDAGTYSIYYRPIVEGDYLDHLYYFNQLNHGLGAYIELIKTQ